MEKIHVCMIGYGLHPPWNEGYAVVFRNLYLVLKDYLNISVISPFNSLRGFSHISENKSNRCLLRPYYPFTQIRKRGKYILLDKMIDSIRILRELNSLNYINKIDIIHIFNIGRFMISVPSKILWNKKVVSHILGSSKQSENLLKDTYFENFVDAYMCGSMYNYRSLINSGIQKQKVHLVPPIIDCNVYRPLTRVHDYNKCSYNISYIGNLHPERFPLEILFELQKLINAHYDIQVYLIASDTYLNRKRALKLNALPQLDKSRFHIITSNLTEKEKVSFFNASDIMIFPYTKKVEGKKTFIVDPPLAVLESMACGKIVITSDVLNLSNLIDNTKNAFLFDPSDFEGFRNTLIYIMQHYEELKKVRKKARATIQKEFSPLAVRSNVINIYKRVLSED